MSIPDASALTEPSFSIQPSTAVSGGQVTVTGHCDAPTKPLVRSSGFVAPIPLGGAGKVVQRPGYYQATMKCGDVTVAGIFFIEGGSKSWIFVLPDPVEPGGEIMLRELCHMGAETMATSPGFAAPIKVYFAGSSGYGHGQGKAANRPGRYTVKAKCRGPGTQGPGDPLEATFTILGNPDPGNPPTTEPPKKSKKPAQVVQKPKGAAETGGGFAAGRRS